MISKAQRKTDITPKKSDFMDNEIELNIVIDAVNKDTVAQRIVDNNKFVIDIFLAPFEVRKNIALNGMFRRINAYYLVEHICATICSMGIWNEKEFCKYNGTHGDCKVKTILRHMDIFFR